MPAKKNTFPRKSSALFVPEKIAQLGYVLRQEKVLLDADLAKLYGVETGHINRAVQRNVDRFPADFMFQITDDELDAVKCQSGIAKTAESNLKCQTVIPKSRGDRRTLPYAFTEQGVAVLSSVLHSPRAVEVKIAIMRTFVQLRRLMDSNALLAEKIQSLEAKYADHDQQFQIVFDAIRQLVTADDAPKREIGFHAE